MNSFLCRQLQCLFVLKRKVFFTLQEVIAYEHVTHFTRMNTETGIGLSPPGERRQEEFGFWMQPTAWPGGRQGKGREGQQPRSAPPARAVSRRGEAAAPAAPAGPGSSSSAGVALLIDPRSCCHCQGTPRRA